LLSFWKLLVQLLGLQLGVSKTGPKSKQANWGDLAIDRPVSKP
jgi:hypothetical protein